MAMVDDFQEASNVAAVAVVSKGKVKLTRNGRGDKGGKGVGLI